MSDVSISPGAAVLPFTPTPFFESSDARSVVFISGSPYLPHKWTVNRNGHGATDDATITLPISSNPDFTIELFRGQTQNIGLPPGNYNGISVTKNPNGTVVTTDDSPVFVEVFAGFPQDLTPGSLDTSGMTQRFLGIVDQESAAFDDDQVTFTCRSLAAPLLDNKLTSAPLNMTSVQFVQAMASAVGLTANIVLAPGVTPITIQEMLGREFVGGASFNSELYNKAPWDVLLGLAIFDDVDVWVEGATLNYCSPSQVTRSTIPFMYGRDLLRPIGTHSIQRNRNIRVEVRTYSPRTRQSTVQRVETGADGGITVTSSTKTATSSPVFGTPNIVSTSVAANGTVTSASSVSTGGGFVSGTRSVTESGLMIYKVYRPNLSPARANQLAQSLWRQYSQQQYALTFDSPMTKALAAIVPTVPPSSTFGITSEFVMSGFAYQYFNTKYWPRRFSEVFDPSGDGWRLNQVECVSTVLPQGAV